MYKEEFIQYALEREIVLGKPFTLGNIGSGKDVHNFSEFITQSFLSHFKVQEGFALYGSGPAGELLASNLAHGIFSQTGKDFAYSFEIPEKNYSGGARFKAEDNIILLTDVLRDKSLVDKQIDRLPASVSGLFSFIDVLQQENQRLVRDHLEQKYQIKVGSALTINDFLEFLPESDERRNKIMTYHCVNQMRFDFNDRDIKYSDVLAAIVYTYQNVTHIRGKDIPKQVAQITNIPLNEIKQRGTKRSRKRSAARARQLTCFLLRRNYGWSYPKIGRLLGLDHSTVISSERKIEEIISSG